MTGPRLIVTIDGPAGTGKSSVARALAQRLGLAFLDTGAMYRAAAAIAIERGLRLQDEAEIVAAVARSDLHFDFSTDPPTLLCNGRSMMARIRQPDVTALVSPIAGIAPLRGLMVAKQRAVAAAHPRLVAEGRDQGTVVFPDADVKIYLHASAEVRAARRADQLAVMGMPADRDRLLEEIIDRDRLDSTRAVGPLVCAEGAARVDTSMLTFERVVGELERIVVGRVHAKKKSVLEPAGSA